MRLLFIILSFVSLSAEGQILNASAPYRVRSGCATKLLDAYTGAAAAYSLRKLDADYAGSAIRVRRSSDNTEQDIGFVGCGDLDTSSLKTFVGTSGTDDGFVVTWYDQTGSNNMTQSTAGYQPMIMDNGVVNRLDGLPTVAFNGSTDFMTESVSSSQPYTIFIAALIPDASPGGWKMILDGDPVSAVPGILFKTTITEQTLIYAGTVLGDNTERGGKTITSALFNGGSSFFYHNNINIATGNAGSTALANFVIGKNWNSSHYLNTKYYEIVIYNSDQSANRTGIQTNINAYYSIYWDGSTDGILDSYAGASAGYSLRNLSSTYLGPLVRVRRSSDNAEQDIYGTYNGDLDTASLKTFVGTGGTDDGFVVTWYDQSGSRNATQATSGNQPRIMNDGVVTRNGTKVAIEWITGSYLATSNTGITTLATHSEFLVFKETTTVISAGILVYTPAANNDYDRVDAMEMEMSGASDNFQVTGAYPSYLMSVSGSKSLFQLVSHIINAGSGEAWQNGTSIGTDSYGSFTTPGGYILIGARYFSGVNTTYGFKGYMHEIIVYNSEQSANRTGIQTNINTYWQVY